jgi:hypothetical protein
LSCALAIVILALGVFIWLVQQERIVEVEKIVEITKEVPVISEKIKIVEVYPPRASAPATISSISLVIAACLALL